MRPRLRAQRPEAGGQRLLQAVREQRDAPQRWHRAGDPAQLHHGLDGDPYQPPGADEQQHGQRQLDDQGGDEAHDKAAGTVGEREVEPGVTDQQRAGDDHEEDEDLALVPGRPRGRGEADQFGEVKAHPDAAPVVRGVAHGQGQDEDRDPRGQHETARGHEQQAEPPAPAEPGIDQRVPTVDSGQGTGQLTPLIRGHPA
jgi:hypothetical protein